MGLIPMSHRCKLQTNNLFEFLDELFIVREPSVGEDFEILAWVV